MAKDHEVTELILLWPSLPQETRRKLTMFFRRGSIGPFCDCVCDQEEMINKGYSRADLIKPNGHAYYLAPEAIAAIKHICGVK